MSKVTDITDRLDSLGVGRLEVHEGPVEEVTMATEAVEVYKLDWGAEFKLHPDSDDVYTLVRGNGMYHWCRTPKGAEASIYIGEMVYPC